MSEKISFIINHSYRSFYNSKSITTRNNKNIRSGLDTEFLEVWFCFRIKLMLYREYHTNQKCSGISNSSNCPISTFFQNRLTCTIYPLKIPIDQFSMVPPKYLPIFIGGDLRILHLQRIHHTHKFKRH